MAKGGKRPGAGRPVAALTEIKRNWAALILTDELEAKLWKECLDDPNTCMDALRYLCDHKYGKAPQRLDLTGGEPGTKVLLIGHIAQPIP